MTDSKREFLIGYDYGMGGLWGAILARSEHEIKVKYPELYVYDKERPEWMTDEDYERIRARRYDIDEEPYGMLSALLADRDK